MGDDENTSRIRGADWIFNALWTSCGDAQIPRWYCLNRKIVTNHQLYRCSVHIPVTFIFHNGYPIKALHTNLSTGYIERISIQSNAPLERHSGERGFQGDSLQQLRYFRKVLVDFCKDNEYHITQDKTSETKICRVGYIFDCRSM